MNARYGDQLKTVKSLAGVFLKGDSVQGVSKAQLEQLKGVIEAAFQVVEHGTAAVLAAEFRPDGLALRGLAQFADDTPTAEGCRSTGRRPCRSSAPCRPGRWGTRPACSARPGRGSSALMDSFVVDDGDPAAKETIEGLKKELAATTAG